MFPIVLDLSIVPLILVGNGPQTLRRLSLLDEDRAGCVARRGALGRRAHDGKRWGPALPSHPSKLDPPATSVVPRLSRFSCPRSAPSRVPPVAPQAAHPAGLSAVSGEGV